MTAKPPFKFMHPFQRVTVEIIRDHSLQTIQISFGIKYLMHAYLESIPSKVVRQELFFKKKRTVPLSDLKENREKKVISPVH